MSPFDAAIWVLEFLLIFAGFLFVGWLVVKLFLWVVRARFSSLSTRDWLFLAPVILVILYFALSALGIVPAPK